MSSMSIRRVVAHLVIALAALASWYAPAAAKVQVTFHSFNGSVLWGRYPHAFVSFEGTLDETGQVIHENYGFSARTAGPNVLTGPTEHIVMSEKEKYLKSTNRHFSITVSDGTYRRMKAEVIAWRDAPGKFYDLDTRNCIHFVGRLAQLAGLKVSYPEDMLRKPKAWLNHITRLNPQLGALAVR